MTTLVVDRQKLKLYEVIFWGADGYDGDEDTIYLVRATDWRAAVEDVRCNAPRSVHKMHGSTLAHRVHEIGTDSSGFEREQILRGPYFQCAYNRGWRAWYREIVGSDYTDNWKEEKRITPEEYQAEARAYVDVLSASVKGLLRWPDDQVSSWVEHYATELATNPSCMIMHWPVETWVAAAAISESLKERVQGLEGNRLRKDIEIAILNGRSFLDITQIDWVATRERVNALLAKYGERLPE